MPLSDQIPIDDHYSTYSGERYGDEDESCMSRRTLATTTTMYRHENGRTYHAYRDGEYWQPNDEKQNNHEAIVHHLCLMTLRDKLYLAPISNPTRILDIGTGTGIWATDIADRFPSATVIGTDLSPVQPGMQPDNCRFEIDDCMSEWVYPPNHFDFVHIRGLFGSISDWPFLYRQCYEHMEPGGWLEQVEWSIQNRGVDGNLNPNSTLARWSRYGIECGRRINKTFEIAETMAGHIADAGFVDVVERRFKWPIGPWSSDPRLKEIGRWNLLNWEEGMEGWVIAPYTRVLGWSAAEVQEWLVEIRKALRDRKKHVYHEVRLVYARKPFEHELSRDDATAGAAAASAAEGGDAVGGAAATGSDSGGGTAPGEGKSSTSHNASEEETVDNVPSGGSSGTRTVE